VSTLSPLTAAPPAPVEFRQSMVTGVNFGQRIIEVIAAPYGETALVEYRGELWNESFDRHAFDGIEKQPNRVRANRDHDRQRTVGKVINFWPSGSEGLVAAVRIAQTPLGDETLALADEDCLGASVGFAAQRRDQVFDKVRRTRHIVKAFLDHLAFVPDPAYAGAGVLNVRSVQPPATPALDDLRAWMDAHQTQRIMSARFTGRR
jgi:phage head maturation protease